MSCLKILAHIWLLSNIPKLVNSSGGVVDFCYYYYTSTVIVALIF